VDAVVAIEQVVFTRPWSQRSFASLVGDGRTRFLVAEDATGAIVGYAVLHLAGEEAELANLAVAEDVRAQGIGRRLLAGCIELAQRRGVRDVFLEVRVSNLAAQTLYRSAGFVPVARRARYYDRPVEDALVLRLTLPRAPSAGVAATRA
jgi:ribosomal-protein-alanine acetyltransferase